LIDDLRDHQKIFVYKYSTARLSDNRLNEILSKLNNYGDNFLLYVTLGENGKPNGTVEMVKRGLMIGYIDHFNISRDGEELGISHESWLEICRKSYDLWRSSTVFDSGN
jgi:hypothetical protein